MHRKRKNIGGCLALLIMLILYAAAPAFGESGLSEKDQTLADSTKATDIVLTGESIEITQEGTYRLSGTVENGSINVRLAKEGTVWLLLDGVHISNECGAALTSTGCKKLIITLADGSENFLSQGGETPAAEDNDAVIYSRDDLTINGSGSLTIEGGYLDGINCRDSLRIAGGMIIVTAVDDGLVGKDEVVIAGGTVTVTSQEGDGIKSTNAEDEGRGFVLISGGTLSVVTGSGSTSVSRTESEGWRRWDSASEETDTASRKGIKAETTLTISAGNVTIDSVDDALHATDIVLSGGSITLSSGDDGVHADASLAVSGGMLTVLSSYEALEGTDITLSGGEMLLTAYDDGINGAGGNSADETGDSWGFFGRDVFSSSSGTLTITGGKTTVNAEGDGIDVNGSITMSGGEVYVRGPQSSVNGALDYDETFTMTGGTLVAVGAAGMAQGVSNLSVPGISTRLDASGTLSVLDASGNVLMTFAAEGSYHHIVLYSDRLEDGIIYTLSTDGAQQSFTASTHSTGGGGWGGGGRW